MDHGMILSGHERYVKIRSDEIAALAAISRNLPAKTYRWTGHSAYRKSCPSSPRGSKIADGTANARDHFNMVNFPVRLSCPAVNR